MPSEYCVAVRRCGTLLCCWALPMALSAGEHGVPRLLPMPALNAQWLQGQVASGPDPWFPGPRGPQASGQLRGDHPASQSSGSQRG